MSTLPALSAEPFSVTTPSLVSTSIVRPLTSGSASSWVLTLPVMAASPTASPALFIALAVAAIAFDAVVEGETVVVDVVPAGVSVVVVFFSQATSSVGGGQDGQGGGVGSVGFHGVS